MTERTELFDTTAKSSEVASKICAVCGIVKSEAQFPSTGRGLRPACRDCHNSKRRASGAESRRRAAEKSAGETRWRALRERHGITRQQYEAISTAQGDACAMCGKVPESVRPLVVDHCHGTGKVRGLLCVYCNVVVGMLENYGRAAADYLATYGNGNPLLATPDVDLAKVAAS